MCLTSVPTEFQEIDDFNFDEYDSEFLEDKDDLGKCVCAVAVCVDCVCE